jgi:hypothetical protein
MVGTFTSALRNCSARWDVEWNCRITRGCCDRKDELRERISRDMVIGGVLEFAVSAGRLLTLSLLVT